MGWIAQFLSRAVVTGFLFGAAIDVVIGELPKLTGTEVERGQLIPRAAVMAGALGDSHGPPCRRRRLAGRRLRSAGSRTRVCRERWYWSWAGYWPPGCWTSVRGGSPSSVPCRAGCRPSRFPTGRSCGTTPAVVAVAAVALVLIGFSQTAGDARAFAAKHRYQIDIDQESVAQAIANRAPDCSKGCRSRRAFRQAR